MEFFKIDGPSNLVGEIDVRGSKNAATPILAASLLTSKSCIIRNLPLVEDIFRMLEIIKGLGAQIDWIDERSVKIQAKNLNPENIDSKIVTKLRSSVLLMGPLAVRCGSVNIAQPGGCLIGARSVDAHTEALKDMGFKITPIDNGYKCESKTVKKGAREVVLREFSVTATENVLMAASLLEGKTTLKIAAMEPHVQDLIEVLRKMGANISTPTTHVVEIEGKKELNGFEHSVSYDSVEAGTYLILAGVTKSKFKVKYIKKGNLDLVLKKLSDFGMNFTFEKDGIIADGKGELKAVDKVQTLPYPGIPTDLQCNFGVLATQADGVTLIHDPLYESRLKYLEEINQMGGRVVICDPHRALVFGATKLYGKNIKTFDLRGGAALILAALAAKGESVIDNIYQIDRGYERIEERLQGLGAKIERIAQ